MSRTDIREFMKTKMGWELGGVPRPALVRQSEFAGQLRKSTLRMLLELDALDRDHFVWSLFAVETVNRRRLVDYLLFVKRREPDRYDCLVGLLAHDFLIGSATSGREHWDAFERIGRFDFRWPVYYWFHQHVQFAYDWSEDLLPLIRAVPREQARAFLRQCHSRRDPFIEQVTGYLEDDPNELREALDFFSHLEKAL